MLDNKWFDGAEKKFMFMYYQSDSDIFQFKVKKIKDKIIYKSMVNGTESIDKEFEVIQDKVPNIAFRFYVIMMILPREFGRIDLGRIQLIKDEGFEDERKEMIEEEKQRSLEELAKIQVERKQAEKEEQVKKLKLIKQSQE